LSLGPLIPRVTRREKNENWANCEFVVGKYIPSMMASYDYWWARHVGLMAVVAIGEGTGNVVCCSFPVLSSL